MGTALSSAALTMADGGAGAAVGLGAAVAAAGWWAWKNAVTFETSAPPSADAIVEASAPPSADAIAFEASAPPSADAIAQKIGLDAHLRDAVMTSRADRTEPNVSVLTRHLIIQGARKGVIRGEWQLTWSPPLPDGTTIERGTYQKPVRWMPKGAAFEARSTGQIHWRSQLFCTLLDLVPLEAGTYRMGSRASDLEASDDERPQHRQHVEGFSCARTPTTEKQWALAMGGDIDRADIPKVNVSYHDAVAFCNTLSVLAGVDQPYVDKDGTWWPGNGVRLPTEIEWEYAARAGTSTRYFFGDDPKALGEHAWFGENSGGELKSVGQKRPNRWGLFDMHGLVDEWCWSGYAPYPLRVDTSVSTLRPAGAASVGSRVVRGGSFNYSPRLLRSAFRYWWQPGLQNGILGFRCVGPSSLELEALE